MNNKKRLTLILAAMTGFVTASEGEVVSTVAQEAVSTAVSTGTEVVKAGFGKKALGYIALPFQALRAGYNGCNKENAKAALNATGNGLAYVGGKVADSGKAVGNGVVAGYKGCNKVNAKAALNATGNGLAYVGGKVVDSGKAVGNGVVAGYKGCNKANAKAALNATGNGLAYVGGKVVDSGKAVGNGVVAGYDQAKKHPYIAGAVAGTVVLGGGYVAYKLYNRKTGKVETITVAPAAVEVETQTDSVETIAAATEAKAVETASVEIQTDSVETTADKTVSIETIISDTIVAYKAAAGISKFTKKDSIKVMNIVRDVLKYTEQTAERKAEIKVAFVKFGLLKAAK